MLLLFIDDNIIQININTREIVTIYEIHFAHNSGNVYEERFKIYSFHNYNKKLKKMEQILLFKEIERNIIYPCFWEDNSLQFTTVELLNFIGITEFDLFDNIDELPINCIIENPYKIFVDSEKIILIK